MSPIRFGKFLLFLILFLIQQNLLRSLRIYSSLVVRKAARKDGFIWSLSFPHRFLVCILSNRFLSIRIYLIKKKESSRRELYLFSHLKNKRDLLIEFLVNFLHNRLFSFSIEQTFEKINQISEHWFIKNNLRADNAKKDYSFRKSDSIRA